MSVGNPTRAGGCKCWVAGSLFLFLGACAGETGDAPGPTSSDGTVGAAAMPTSSGTGASSVNTGAATGAATVTPPGEFTLSSPAFDAVADCSEVNASVCDVFPTENISYMDAPNVSPELTWGGAPVGVQSFALTLEDVSFGQPLWAIWNIPASSTSLPADLPKDTTTPASVPGAVQANATFAAGDGYFGPQADCNVYRFTLVALSTATFSPSQPEFVALVRDELKALSADVVLGQATLSARSNSSSLCP